MLHLIRKIEVGSWKFVTSVKTIILNPVLNHDGERERAVQVGFSFSRTSHSESIHTLSSSLVFASEDAVALKTAHWGTAGCHQIAPTAVTALAGTTLIVTLGQIGQQLATRGKFCGIVRRIGHQAMLAPAVHRHIMRASYRVHRPLFAVGRRPALSLLLQQFFDDCTALLVQLLLPARRSSFIAAALIHGGLCALAAGGAV